MRRVFNAADVVYLLYSVIPLDWMLAGARRYGRLTYHVNRRQRATVRENLESVFGETKSSAELESLTRRFFEYKRIRGVLLAVSSRLSTAQLERLLPVEGLKHLEAALREGRGVILLGSHLNSVCMFLTVMMLRGRGYDVRVALPAARDPWPSSSVRRFLDRRFRTTPLSEALGALYVQLNIRPIVRCLSGNGMIAQTGDGLHAASFVEVDFLSRRVGFPTGMAAVAQVTGAPVVSVFQLGAPPDGLRTVIEEPWVVDRRAHGNAALQGAVAAYAKRLEHHLLNNIACWEHWLIDDALGTMASWRERPLKERYEV